MSQKLNLDCVSMLPLKDAAERVSYSRDYVAKLARSGQIDATQRGRQWFVALDSLERFAADAEAEREIRRQVLSAQRRAEREAAAQLAAVEAALPRQVQRASRVSLTAAALVFVLGSGFGLLVLEWPQGAAFVSHWQPTPAASQFAVEESRTMQRRADQEVRTTLAPETTVITELPLEPSFATTREQYSLATDDGLLVLASEGVDVANLSEVEELFSHEVVVRQLPDGSWRIHRADGNGQPIGEGIPFLAVPRGSEVMRNDG